MEITKTQWFILLFLIVSFIAVGGVAAFVSASLLAFIPAYFYLKSIRNTEVEGKEPWPAVRTAFIWGALSGVFLAMFLNAIGTSLLLVLLADSGDVSTDDLGIIVGAVIVAPIVEEFVKPLVMLRSDTVRKEIDEIEDGIIYGAACGLGFGATENILYGLTEGLALAGFAGLAFLIVIRTVSSILLHLVATSYTGYGISRYLVNGESFSVVVKYFSLAVLIHAVWNLAAIYSLVFDSETGSFFIFVFSIVLAISGLQLAKRRIVVLDTNVPILPVRETLPPSNDKWSGSNKWSAKDDKWNRESLWDSKKRETGDSYRSDTAYATDTISQSREDRRDSNPYDFRTTIGIIVFLLFLTFEILGFML